MQGHLGQTTGQTALMRQHLTGTHAAVYRNPGFLALVWGVFPITFSACHLEMTGMLQVAKNVATTRSVIRMTTSHSGEKPVNRGQGKGVSEGSRP